MGYGTDASAQKSKCFQMLSQAMASSVFPAALVVYLYPHEKSDVKRATCGLCQDEKKEPDGDLALSFLVWSSSSRMMSTAPRSRSSSLVRVKGEENASLAPLIF